MVHIVLPSVQVYHSGQVVQQVLVVQETTVIEQTVKYHCKDTNE